MKNQELREYSHDLLRDILQLMMRRSGFEDVTLKLCHTMVALDKVALEGDLSPESAHAIRARSMSCSERKREQRTH